MGNVFLILLSLGYLSGFLGELQFVPYLVAVLELPPDGVADAQAEPLGHDLLSGDAQGRHGAAVDIPGRVLLS